MLKITNWSIYIVLFISLITIKLVEATSMNQESIVLGMGCFWGSQKHMAAISGVITTQVGYAGGDAINPTYKTILADEYNSQIRNHAEVVKVTFDPTQVNLETILGAFWQNHDPTQSNRQGNDIGSNYRSAIYYANSEQRIIAERTKTLYQQSLSKAGYGNISTEIVPLKTFYPAEDYHQNYLQKNPNGYCGLGGTGVLFPNTPLINQTRYEKLDSVTLNSSQQLVMFEVEGCHFCKQFTEDMLINWQAAIPIARSLSNQPPRDWTLIKPVFASPTIVWFKNGKEIDRYTGYDGNKQRFWNWLGNHLLTDEQRRIAYEAGTEPAFSGSLLDQKQAGTYVDSVTGVPLFRSETKFHSGTGWPSFFNPIAGALILHSDNKFGMQRIEVRSASSGIHLGHVFDDGPTPSGKRYCINSAVLRFIPDE